MSGEAVREQRIQWPVAGVSRVPFEIYTDPALYESEQESLFKGPIWHFVAVDIEIPAVGDFKTNFVGDTPVVVVKSSADSYSAFVNRCAHRGSTLCYEKTGNRDAFTCVYHNWSYDLEGNLKTVAFHKGVRGKGGMPDDFQTCDHNLQKLRVQVFCGLLFISFDHAAPDLEKFLGPKMSAHIRRIFSKKIRILGAFSQYMHNNWKLYMENVKDSYHASLLHTVFTTFKVNRLSMQGGLILEGDGGHHISYSKMATDSGGGADYESGGLRAQNDEFVLHDNRILKSWPEFEDGITHAIQGIFPNLIVQQIQNSLALRLLIPRGVNGCELVWIAHQDNYRRNATVLGSAELFHRVRPLYDAYADCIDEEQFEKWPEFFEDICFYQITTREAVRKSFPIGIVQCNSKGMLIDRINSMKRANIFEPQRYRHLLGALHVEASENGTIRARMGFAIVRILESGETMLFLSGVWKDKIVETPEGLRFREKIAVLDSSCVDTLIVVPV